jgi:hypothetical protein
MREKENRANRSRVQREWRILCLHTVWYVRLATDLGAMVFHSVRWEFIKLRASKKTKLGKILKVVV